MTTAGKSWKVAEHKKTGKRLNCKHCSNSFYAERNQVQNGRKFCSKLCLRNSQGFGKAIHKHNCLYCGKQFFNIKKNQNFCGTSCSAKARVPLNRRKDHPESGFKHDCKHCGIQFKTKSQRKQNFCSVACRAENIRLPKKICPQCNDQFRPHWRNSKFCSMKCFADSIKKNYRPCLTCGEIFSRNKTAKFCSRECKMNQHGVQLSSIKDRRTRTTKLARIYRNPSYQIGLILKEAAKIKTSLIAAEGD